MNKLWQKWKNRRRPRRGVRILRNILIGLLLIPVIWALLDYPLPREMQFRRMERTNLIPVSEIVYQDDEGNVVGVLENTVLCASVRGANPGDWEYRRYEIGEEPVAVPLVAPFHGLWYATDKYNRFLVFNAPEQTDYVEMEINTGHFGVFSVIRVDSSDAPQTGMFLFSFAFDEAGESIDPWYLPRTLANGNTRYPYRMTFYSGDAVIAIYEATLPVGVPNKWQYNYPTH